MPRPKLLEREGHSAREAPSHPAGAESWHRPRILPVPAGFFRPETIFPADD